MIYMKSQIFRFKKGCDKCKIKSVNHEMYLPRVLKSTLSPFDDKRCYLNEIESILLGLKIRILGNVVFN